MLQLKYFTNYKTLWIKNPMRRKIKNKKPWKF